MPQNAIFSPRVVPVSGSPNSFNSFILGDTWFFARDGRIHEFYSDRFDRDRKDNVNLGWKSIGVSEWVGGVHVTTILSATSGLLDHEISSPSTNDNSTSHNYKSMQNPNNYLFPVHFHWLRAIGYVRPRLHKAADKRLRRLGFRRAEKRSTRHEVLAKTCNSR